MAAGTAAEETPIAREIHDFVVKISAIAFVLGISFFIFGMLSNPDWLANIVFLIGIIVANVPEGLLATVTVSLTLTARRMAIKKVRVKNLESVETLGSTSVICSDKTGTLTTSIMTCADVVFDMQRKPTDTSDPEHATEGDFYDKETGGQLPSFKRLLRCGVLCNNSEVIVNKKSGKRSYSSDPTEQAIFKFCLGNIPQTLDTKTPVKAAEFREKHYPKLAEIPFNSKNKWQVSVHLVDTEEACFEGEKRGDSIVEIKGAPERILNLCDSYCFEGKQYKLDEEAKNQIRALNAELAECGERVLGFADLLCPGGAYPQEVKKVVFDEDAMTVNGVAIPKSGGSDGSVVVKYNDESIEVNWKDLKNGNGEPFESFSKCTLRSMLAYLSEQINMPPAQMRFFNYGYSKENGELDDDSMSMADCQINESGDVFLLATGPYRFSTSAND